MSGRDQTHSARSPSSRALLTSVETPKSENFAPPFCAVAETTALVSAVHQNIRHRLDQHLAAGYREQMVLALGLGVVDQRGLVEPFAVREEGTRDLDRGIRGQHADDLARRVGKPGDTAAELRAGRTFDIFEQPAHHGVEQLDLIVGERSRPEDKQIGHLAQDIGAPRDDPCCRGRLRVRSIRPARVHVHIFESHGSAWFRALKAMPLFPGATDTAPVKSSS